MILSDSAFEKTMRAACNTLETIVKIGFMHYPEVTLTVKALHLHP